MIPVLIITRMLVQFCMYHTNRAMTPQALEKLLKKAAYITSCMAIHDESRDNLPVTHNLAPLRISEHGQLAFVLEGMLDCYPEVQHQKSYTPITQSSSWWMRNKILSHSYPITKPKRA